MIGTVKQFKDILEEMKTIYPYKDEDTILSTNNRKTMHHDALEISTTDEETGIKIVMAKQCREVENNV